MPSGTFTRPYYCSRIIMQFIKCLVHYYFKIIMLRHALQPSYYFIIKLSMTYNFIITELLYLLMSEFLINSLSLLMICNFIMIKLSYLFMDKFSNNSFLLLIICNFIMTELLYLLISRFFINFSKIIA